MISSPKFRTFKISLRQQLILLSRLIGINSLLLGIYFYFFGTIVPSGVYVYLFAFIILFDILPTLVVHIQYYLKNKGLEVTLNSSDLTLSYRNKDGGKTYLISDIKHMERTSSYGQGSGWYSFEAYRYYQIRFMDNTNLIITCLMINRIEEELEQFLKKESTQKFKFLALLPGHSSVSAA